MTVQAVLHATDLTEAPLDAAARFLSELVPVAREMLGETIDALGDTHFKLIEAVADHVCETLFLQDARIEAVTVKIVKLALSEADEKIGITLHRERH